MEDRFFLSSQDWGEPWGPRECSYQDAYIAKPTGQVLFSVRVTPALPREFGEGDSDVDELLLGPISNEWTLKDIGRPDFVVDIYIPRILLNGTAVNVKNLVRVGVGKLHKTREEAESG